MLEGIRAKKEKKTYEYAQYIKAIIEFQKIYANITMGICSLKIMKQLKC